jgi:hypothetical protein
MRKRLKMAGRQFFLLTFLSFILVGCGFQPLLSGQHETPQKFNLSITGTGYSAYKFRRELEKQLALTPKINNNAYIINISVSEGYVPIAYGTDATISRSQVQAMATYSIQLGRESFASGVVTSYSSYILNYTEEFSTRSAQTAASERALINLAEELSREIMLKIRSLPEVAEKTKLNLDKDHNW